MSNRNRQKCLKGQLIVLTRAQNENCNFRELLKNEGAEVYEFPCIRISNRDINARTEKKILSKQLDAVIFTSTNSAKFFLHEAKIITKIAQAKIVAIGKQTENFIKDLGLKVDLVPSSSNRKVLLDEIGEVNGKTIIVPHSSLSPGYFTKQLKKKGARVISFVAYQTDFLNERDVNFEIFLSTGEIDWIVFASASAVTGSLKRVPKNFHNHLFHTPVIAFGEEAARKAKINGYRMVYIAKEPNIEGIIKLIKEHQSTKYLNVN